MGRARLLAYLSACTAALVAVAASPAGAHGPAEGEADHAHLHARVTGPGTEPAHSGLLRVRPEVGPALLTHGPDTREAATAAPTAARGGIGFDSGDAERPPACASANYQHVLYGRTAGSPDRLTTVRPQIQAQMRRTNAVLNAESLASGGPTADYRMLCDGAGAIRVDGFTSSGTSFSAIVSAARAAGFNADDANYTIFFEGDAGNACGIGSYSDDERLAADNQSNFGGGYAVVYSGCWQGSVAMHENGHNMGAVQYGAPNSTGTGGHCDEDWDVMCYSPDGGDRNQGGTVERCPGTPRFDCGFDDYFDAAPEPGEYLATHWNIGSPLNRFLAFGSGDPGGGDPDGGDPGGGDPGTGDPGGGGTVSELIGSLLGGGRISGATSGSAGAPGEWRLVELRVPRRTRSLRVRIAADPGSDLALYLRRGSAPTEDSYSCRAVPAAGQLGCKVSWPRRGNWYAGVLTRSGAAGAAFEVAARLRRW